MIERADKKKHNAWTKEMNENVSYIKLDPITFLLTADGNRGTVRGLLNVSPWAWFGWCWGYITCPPPEWYGTEQRRGPRSYAFERMNQTTQRKGKKIYKLTVILKIPVSNAFIRHYYNFLCSWTKLQFSFYRLNKMYEDDNNIFMCVEFAHLIIIIWERELIYEWFILCHI